MNLECHITVPTDHAKRATAVAVELDWKTSEIARDPVLGDKNFFYLTKHSTDVVAMVSHMRRCVLALHNLGIPVLREKIEAIIHDIRHG